MTTPRSTRSSNPAPDSGVRMESDGALSIRFALTCEYPVLFTRMAWAAGNCLLRDRLAQNSDLIPHPFVVFLDAGLAAANPALPDAIRNYARIHSDTLTLAADPVVVPGGESVKNDSGNFKETLRFLLHSGLCRHSTVVVMGGGAVLDAVGLAAALAHRGLRLLRMPSTVLSQNDAGIGVKNGINAWGIKNAVGAFAPPLAVINDLDLLRTLDSRHWIAGIAEAFKVAIIQDSAFFRNLRRDARRLRERNEAAMERLIRRCARLHLEHIASGGDPFERGAARPLDFGHWAAHQLETLSEFRIPHGEAVSVGIALDSLYAARGGWLSESELNRILAGLSECGLPVFLPELDLRNAGGERLIFDGLRSFREHLGGRLCVTFPDGIGRRREESEIDRLRMNECIDALRQRADAFFLDRTPAEVVGDQS